MSDEDRERLLAASSERPRWIGVTRYASQDVPAAEDCPPELPHPPKAQTEATVAYVARLQRGADHE